MNFNKISNKKKQIQTQILKNCFCDRILSKRSQEEMVGFGIIIGIVSIIIIVFISIMLSSPSKENLESYEAESFIQSILQYTTNCSDNLERLTIQKLMFDCAEKKKCLDDRSACEVLEKDLAGISRESWHIGEGSLVKGYSLEILNNGANLINVSEGNLTGNSRGSFQDFSKSGKTIEIRFSAYY